ncbi:MAG TPA: outer membrane protein assembly factor BamD [Candidatus Polarisedimenticolia bacterium]|nr:outer membrane protein assembly factor BamD [Candidatus Polarisedimenticolia bacterium]
MRTLTVLSLATALLLLAAAPAAAAEDQQLYAAGRDAVFEERWQDARRLFEDFTRRFPSSAYADDAHYWLGMALYELREPEDAYVVLKRMNGSYPESPWSDDARVLMVRCAESVLKSSVASRSSRPSGGPVPLTAEGGARLSRLSEYEAFIERSTHDSSSKVQLLAIDTMLGTRPERAAELLPRLSGGNTSREAAGVVLDRFFEGETVKVTVEDPAQGFTEGNIAIMVRQADEVAHLTLSGALDLLQAGPARAGRFDEGTIREIRDKLLRAEKNLVREGGPGSVETHPGPGGKSMSAIVKVVDGEVHYYRSGEETTRIVVLRRDAGFNEDNIRVFVELRSGVREIPLAEARRLQPAGPGRPAPATSGGLSDGTLRYLKAALAIIEIDLTREDGAAR